MRLKSFFCAIFFITVPQEIHGLITKTASGTTWKFHHGHLPRRETIAKTGPLTVIQNLPGCVRLENSGYSEIWHLCEIWIFPSQPRLCRRKHCTLHLKVKKNATHILKLKTWNLYLINFLHMLHFALQNYKWENSILIFKWGFNGLECRLLKYVLKFQ